jgi:hypothetical protein
MLVKARGTAAEFPLLMDAMKMLEHLTQRH